MQWTGWYETEAGWVYVTPGGIVGELPDGVRVGVPPGVPEVGKFGVADGTYT
jgi:hypothetical protein